HRHAAQFAPLLGLPPPGCGALDDPLQRAGAEMGRGCAGQLRHGPTPLTVAARPGAGVPQGRGIKASSGTKAASGRPAAGARATSESSGATASTASRTASSTPAEEHPLIDSRTVATP